MLSGETLIFVRTITKDLNGEMETEGVKRVFERSIEKYIIQNFMWRW